MLVKISTANSGFKLQMRVSASRTCKTWISLLPFFVLLYVLSQRIWLHLPDNSIFDFWLSKLDPSIFDFWLSKDLTETVLSPNNDQWESKINNEEYQERRSLVKQDRRQLQSVGSVIGYDIFNGKSNQKVGDLVNGTTIVLRQYGITSPTHLNFVAITEGNVGSVTFVLSSGNSTVTTTENIIPFAVCGNVDDDIFTCPSLSVGSTTLQSIPYEKTRKEGKVGVPYVVSFRISFENSPTLSPRKPALSPSRKPTLAPIRSPTSKRCFQTNTELQNAVNQYIGGNTTIQSIYGNPIGTWCVKNITDFSGVFAGQQSFNEDISSWDVSAAKTLEDMFSAAYSFNQDLSKWNVSGVTNMRNMFFTAISFNKNLSNWDVSNVKDMQAMFLYAMSFQQNLCSWGKKLKNNTIVIEMFYRSNCFDAVNDPSFASYPPGPFCFYC